MAFISENTSSTLENVIYQVEVTNPDRSKVIEMFESLAAEYKVHNLKLSTKLYDTQTKNKCRPNTIYVVKIDGKNYLSVKYVR